ncbi:MAG: flagellar hook-basal body complex protein FliE [Candidatus Methylumidiphilus sp.]
MRIENVYAPKMTDYKRFMSRIDTSSIQEMVAQIRSVAVQIGSGKAAEGMGGEFFTSGKIDFADMLESALKRVDAAQNEANDMGQRFSLGDHSVNISDVMIADQKANIALQATLQVRNRLVNTYTSIMNMAI